jgi:hypothetical protein
MLRGRLCAPFLIGLFSLTFLALALCLMVDLLKIKSLTVIAVLCGIFATAASVSLANATYISWTDIFMLAFLANVLSVFFQRRYKYGFFPGALMVAVSLALYQSFFEVAAVLSLILLIKDCLDGLPAKSILVRGVKALASLLIGLALYYICLQVVVSRVNIDLSATYNGIANVGDYSGKSIPRLLVKTYLFPFRSIASPLTFHPVLSAVVNIGMLVLAAAALVRTCLRKKPAKLNVLFLILFVLLIPLGMNAVYFISKEMKHALMTYSFCFFYVFAFVPLEYGADATTLQRNPDSRSGTRTPRNFVRIIMVAATGILILNNIVYANQLYLKKELEYQATLSTMTRIVDRIEQADGYILQETPVAIIGSLNESVLAVERPGFTFQDALGMELTYSVTYPDTYNAYFSDILGYPINLVADREQIAGYENLAQVQSMPAFPASGCCAMLDGVLIVKLS